MTVSVLAAIAVAAIYIAAILIVVRCVRAAPLLPDGDDL